MGASTFVVRLEGSEKDGNRLFRDAAQQDRSEYGQGAYSGSIGQKRGFEVLNRQPLLPDEVRDFVDANIDRSDKWDETACAATVAAVTGKPRRRSFTVKAKDKAEAVAKAKARVRTKTPQSIKVVAAKATSSTHSNKVRRKKHGGKAKIKWAFSDRGGLYDTPLEAAKAAEAYLVKAAHQAAANEARFGHAYPVEGLSIYPVAVLEGNDGTTTPYRKKPVAYSVSIGRDDRAATWEVELELRTVNPGKVGGWVFFGWKAE